MNKVLKQSIINGRIEIVCILLARIYLQRRYRVVFVLFLKLKKNLIKKIFELFLKKMFGFFLFFF